MSENTSSNLTPSPEPVRAEPAKSRQQAEAVAKSKSDERRAHLEQFRAAQVDKRAKALGLKTDAPAAKPPQSSRPLSGQRSTAEPRRATFIPRTPHPPSPARSSSADPEPLSKSRVSLTKPPRAVSAASTPAASTAPRLATKTLPKVPSARKKPSAAEVATVDAKQGSQWTEGQQVFGFEAAKPIERRASATGYSPDKGLPAELIDDGNPLSGLRWQVQLERLQLQQWQILNARMAAAMAAQRQQAEQQISQAAEAVVAVQQELAKEKARRAIQQSEQHAAAALAAQLPRLELYSQIKDEHEQSIQDITEAVARSLQHMPLVNGATCGDAPEGAKENGESGLPLTAKLADALADTDGQLRMLLESNAGLLRQVEHEVIHAESLAVQLLQTEAGQ